MFVPSYFPSCQLPSSGLVIAGMSGVGVPGTARGTAMVAATKRAIEMIKQRIVDVVKVVRREYEDKG